MMPHDKFGPVDAMREVFVIAHGRLARAEYPELSGKPCWEYPHAQLAMAWCVISQPYYNLAHVRRNSAIDLQNYEEHLGNTITLDANEGRLLSAMAEAVGIPNPFGPKTPEKQEPR
jgi:hypothetical protein